MQLRSGQGAALVSLSLIFLLWPHTSRVVSHSSPSYTGQAESYIRTPGYGRMATLKSFVACAQMSTGDYVK